jgi:putative inorganic carbon (HCO3(-)) transporter
LNSQTASAHFVEQPAEKAAAQHVAGFLGKGIYVALLILLVLTALAYGGTDPWWKAFFTCAIFVLGVFWFIERILSDARQIAGLDVMLPMLALVIFAWLQTMPLGQSDGSAYGISYRLWRSISADPYETRIFALQLLGLVLLAALFFRYASDERRLRTLIHVIIGIALLSALFGILRQTTQHQAGFVLPLLQLDQGYGQFINRNHFAFLMEMGLGLALGLIAGSGISRERALIYLAASLPIWTALVLSNSRGGLMAMMAQLVIAVLLFGSVIQSRDSDLRNSRAVRLARSTGVRLVLVAAVIVLVSVGMLWVGGDRLATRLEATRGEFGDTNDGRAGVTRLKIWRATGEMIKANPVAGVGMGGYWIAIPTYHDASGALTPQQAHNDYLELAASGGLVGLAIGVWFVVVVFKRARANLQSPERFRRAACFAALIGITGVAVHSLVDFGLHRMINAMVFTALIVIATCNVKGESYRLKNGVQTLNN